MAAALWAAGAAWTAYDTYTTYQEEGGAAAVQQLVTDGVITLVAGPGKAAYKVGGKVYDSGYQAWKAARAGSRVDDIWGGNRTVLENVTTRGTNIERVPGGTRAQAEADFDALGLSNVRNIGTDRRMGTLPDGTTVIVRPSRDGRPTVEFQRVTENGNTRTTREIRYGD